MGLQHTKHYNPNFPFPAPKKKKILKHLPVGKKYLNIKEDHALPTTTTTHHSLLYTSISHKIWLHTNCNNNLENSLCPVYLQYKHLILGDVLRPIFSGTILSFFFFFEDYWLLIYYGFNWIESGTDGDQFIENEKKNKNTLILICWLQYEFKLEIFLVYSSTASVTHEGCFKSIFFCVK